MALPSPGFLLPFVTGGFAAGIACLGLRPWGLRSGWVSRGGSDRAGPGGVPTTGGWGMMIGCAAGAAVAIAAGRPMGPVGPPLALLAGFGLIGAIDDARGLTPLLRLAAEFALAGGIVLLVGGGALPVAVLCVAGANAVNMADNADGLVAATAGLSLLSLAAAHPWAAAGAGALGAFLIWNRPPARLYLGDAGALPLGALGAWLLAPGNLIAGVFTAGYLLFDPLYAVAGRLRARRAPWVGGVDHPSHDLTRLLGCWPRAWGLILAVHAVSVAAGLAIRGGWPPAPVASPVAVAWAALWWIARRGRR